MSDDPYQAPNSLGATEAVPVVKDPLDVIARRPDAQIFVTSPDSILLASA